MQSFSSGNFGSQCQESRGPFTPLPVRSSVLRTRVPGMLSQLSNPSWLSCSLILEVSDGNYLPHNRLQEPMTARKKTHWEYIGQSVYKRSTNIEHKKVFDAVKSQGSSLVPVLPPLCGHRSCLRTKSGNCMGLQPETKNYSKHEVLAGTCV